MDFDNLNVQKMSRYFINKLTMVRDGDCGLYGKVYRLNEKECLKYFKYAMDEFDLYSFNELTNYSFTYATFPKKLIIVNRKFHGYIMNYINGIKLEKSDDLNFSFALKAYKKFIDGILDEVVEEKFEMYDVHDSNIMYDYDSETFKSIDCDDWAKSDESKEKLRQRNFGKLNHAFSALINAGYVENIDYRTDFIDYYETMRENRQKVLRKKLITIGDFKE